MLFYTFFIPIGSLVFRHIHDLGIRPSLKDGAYDPDMNPYGLLDILSVFVEFFLS